MGKNLKEVLAIQGINRGQVYYLLDNNPADEINFDEEVESWDEHLANKKDRGEPFQQIVVLSKTKLDGDWLIEWNIFTEAYGVFRAEPNKDRWTQLQGTLYYTNQPIIPESELH